MVSSKSFNPRTRESATCKASSTLVMARVSIHALVRVRHYLILNSPKRNGFNPRTRESATISVRSEG